MKILTYLYKTEVDAKIQSTYLWINFPSLSGTIDFCVWKGCVPAEIVQMVLQQNGEHGNVKTGKLSCKNEKTACH